jgi:LmbE family N-acetylglucosaminyl deacetylase
VLARRSEDTNACAVLGATAMLLDLFDGQYEQSDDQDDALRAELTRVLARLSTDVVYVPLGIRHPDHRLVGAAARAITVSLGLSVVVYDELPYRVEEPEEHSAARARLRDDGWLLEAREEALGPIELKSAAIDRYVSQERKFPRQHLLAAEQYFTATRQTPSG